MSGSIRYIRTDDLPASFDVGDLCAQPGMTTDALYAWMRERIHVGTPPSEPKPTPVKRPDNAVDAAGPRGATPGRGREVIVPTQPKLSTPAVSHAGNVATILKAEPAPMLDMPPEYSDDALADKFAERHVEDMLYVSTWNRWMLWKGALWDADETLEATDLSRRICREHGAEALLRPDLKAKARAIATSLTSARTIASTERLARSDRRLSATPKQWDHDPWALNTPAGVIDLTSGLLRPARKTDYVTKTTAVSAGGKCPTWHEFLRVATDGDMELVEFMRRMAGYCLTGITREHALFFVYGSGGNGKGTFLNTLQWILNTYARTASMDIFTEQRFDNARADVAGLMGARMVTAQEVQEGKRWNETRLKEMTGGDTVSAKFLYSNPFEFVPQFKLVFAGNHKPQLRNVDEAIKRRLHLIPFTVTVPYERRDQYLADKLKAEASGILQWAIEGCIDWQRNMLAPPERVQVATEQYFEREDVLGTFIEECCIANSAMRVKTSELYQRYGRWCEANGEFTLPRKRWLEQLSLKAMESMKVNGDMVILGLGLQQDGPRPHWQDD